MRLFLITNNLELKSINDLIHLLTTHRNSFVQPRLKYHKLQRDRHAD